MYQIYFQVCIIIAKIFLHASQFILLDMCTGPVPELRQIFNGPEHFGP